MSGKLVIDPNRQLAARKATKAMLDRVFVSGASYKPDGRPTTYRVLLRDTGLVYKVDGRQLAGLRAGKDPGDYMLDPLDD